MNGTPSIDLIEIFLAVAAAKSFSRASLNLRMPKSSVSRGMVRLEAQLGVELFHRTTHHVALTAAGETLRARVATQFVSLKESLKGLPGQSLEPNGKLRIAAPPDFGVSILSGAITSYAAAFSKVQVEVVLDNRHVDLIREGFDIAIRAHRRVLKDSSMQIRRLGMIQFGFYASVSYIKRRGVPEKPGDPNHEWVGTRTRPFEVEPGPSDPRLASDDFLFVRELIRAGAGVGLLPGYVAACDISSKKLVRVLAQNLVKPAGLAMLSPRARHASTNVAAFRTVLLEHLAKNPTDDVTNPGRTCSASRAPSRQSRSRDERGGPAPGQRDDLSRHRRAP